MIEQALEYLSNENVITNLINSFSDIEKPFVLRVGVTDIQNMDYFYNAMCDNPDWEGIIYEPIPEIFEELKNKYSEEKFQLKQSLIGSENTNKTLFLKKSSNPNTKTKSFDKEQLTNDDCIDQIQVVVESLENIPKINLLQIDIDIYDANIVSIFNIETLMPDVICVKHYHLNDIKKCSLIYSLQKADYSVIDLGDEYLATSFAFLKRFGE